MTAPVAIGAAVSPPDVNATTAGKLVGSFGDVLARAQCQKAIQVAGHGESEKAKQTSGDDELANKEIAATTGTALPPNLILVPNAPVPVPTPVPDLQPLVLVKQVAGVQKEDADPAVTDGPNSAFIKSQPSDSDAPITPLEENASKARCSTSSVVCRPRTASLECITGFLSAC